MLGVRVTAAILLRRNDGIVRIETLASAISEKSECERHSHRVNAPAHCPMLLRQGRIQSSAPGVPPMGTSFPTRRKNSPSGGPASAGGHPGSRRGRSSMIPSVSSSLLRSFPASRWRDAQRWPRFSVNFFHVASTSLFWLLNASRRRLRWRVERCGAADEHRGV